MTSRDLADQKDLGDHTVSARPDVGGVVVREELVLLSASGRQVHRLNASARVIWEELCAGKLPEQLVSELSAHYNVEPQRIRRDVAHVIDELERGQLLERRGDAKPTLLDQERSASEGVEEPASPVSRNRHVIGPFVALDSVVTIEVAGASDDAEIRWLIERLERAVEPLIRHGRPIEIGRTSLVELQVGKSDLGWFVRSNHNGTSRYPTIESSYRGVLAEVNAGPIADLHRCVGFHAGGVEFPKGLVIFPGRSNSGKSTLVINLLERGHRYLTDEVVALDTATGEAQPFPKAICVDEGAQAIFTHFRDPLDTGPTWDVDPIRISDAPLAASAPPIAVVFSTFESGVTSELRRLPPVEAANRLLENAFDLANSGSAGATRLLRLAVDIPCFELRHGGQVEHLELLEAHFGSRSAVVSEPR